MEIHGKLLAEGLAEKGHAIHIISTRHPDGTIKANKNGINLHYLQDTAFGSYRKGWKNLCIQKFQELNKKMKFDVICSQSYSGYPYNRPLKGSYSIPMVSILHGSVIQGLNSWWINFKSEKTISAATAKGLLHSAYAYLFIQNPLIQNSDCIICVSDQIENEIRKYHHVKTQTKTRIVYNGIDCDLFSPDQKARDKIRGQYNIKDEDTLLLSIGSITREKGHHLSIKVLKLLKEKGVQVKLIVAGEGPLLPHLKKMVNSSSLNDLVIFKGYIPNKDTPNYYNASDILLFPSLRYEGLPFTILESLSCGKPIIAHDIGSIRSAISDGMNGYLVKSGDFYNMAARLEQLLKDKSLYNDLSVRARDSVINKFSHQQMVDNTINCFESVIAG